MKLNQLCEVLNKQEGKSNAERMNKAIRSVLTETAKQMSQGKEAYEEARQKDFEKKREEDFKNPQQRTFKDMVDRYL